MAATEAFVRSIQAGIRPDERVSIAEWAEKYRILPPDTPEPGRWRNERTPYLVGIMEALSPGSPYRIVALMKGHQLGGSALGENFVGSAITMAAGNLLAVFATKDDAEKWETDRFDKMRESTPELRRRIRTSEKKGAATTKLRKRFPGGMLNLVSATRAGRLKSTTVRYVLLEEVDEYELNVDEQGNPIDLALKRTSNFGRRAKVFANSTPTIDGRSQIQKLHGRGDQRRYFVHCPECDHAQSFTWKNMRWPDAEPDAVVYHCEACGVGCQEHRWKAGYPRAFWQATAQGDGETASFHLSSLYAPIGWRPWPQLARDWIAAQGDTEKLIAFTNNELAECWQDTLRSELTADALQQRAEPYDLMTCPPGGLIAAAGVDVQDDRLEIVIRAYGRGEESWGLFHAAIYGNPSAPDLWVKLAEILESPIKHASGQIMRVEAAAIDTGGHHAEDVYAFCRGAFLKGRHWIAIKGAPQIDAPIIGKPRTIQFNWRGQAVPGGVQLRHVGTQGIKNKLDGRLREIKKPGAGCIHFPMGFNADYYKQLRSERREWRRDRTGKKALWWVKGTERNEAWDCEVYAYAAFHYLTASSQAIAFAAREKVYGTTQRDLFAEGEAGCAAQSNSTPASAGNDSAEVSAAVAGDETPAPIQRRPPAKRPARRGFVSRYRG